MNALRHDEATMTPAEAEAIVARLAARDRTGALSVTEVAEALRLSPDEVARLLDEVRAVPPKTIRPERRTLRRERRVWLLSGGLALVLVAVGLAAAPPTVGPFARRAHPAYAARYELLLDGTGVGTAFTGATDPHAIAEGIDPILDAQEMRNRGSNSASSIDDAERTLAAAREGRWRDVPDLRFGRLEIDRPDPLGHQMRWADERIPIYSGNDAHVAEIVRAERARRVERALEAARGDSPTRPPAAVAPTAPGTGT